MDSSLKRESFERQGLKNQNRLRRIARKNRVPVTTIYSGMVLRYPRLRATCTLASRQRGPPANISRSILTPIWRRFTSTKNFVFINDHFELNNELRDEYKPGGYHPVWLGDLLKDERYKIIHKLGHGTFSTVWAARDRQEGRYVALKINIAKKNDGTEARMLRAISSLPDNQYGGRSHIRQIFDDFVVTGPNGDHQCFVLELMGPSVLDLVNSHFHKNHRIPGALAKATARQVLSAIDFLAGHGLVHGDIHTKNIAFPMPNLDELSESQFIDRFGLPKAVKAYGMGEQPSSTVHAPPYILDTLSFANEDSLHLLGTNPQVKIIDFDTAFPESHPPDRSVTPIVLRPPEAIFGERQDRHVDRWAMGCLLFELVCGQTPFTSLGAIPASMVAEMRQTLTDEFPERWREKWEKMKGNFEGESITRLTIHDCVQGSYFFKDRKPDFTDAELRTIVELIDRMLKFEPSLRASPRDILNHSWFDTDVKSESGRK
ncbi:kinase-like protein [Nemania sp. FL0916]|nr:kinase-like protein [Nemania sp. FL0916]